MTTTNSILVRVLPALIFIVLSACGGGGSNNTNTTGQTPSIPNGLTASASNSTSISLIWNAEANATGYNVYRSTTANFSVLPANKINNNPVTTPSFNDTQLLSSKRYYYKVSSLYSSGEVSGQNEVSAVTPALETASLAIARYQHTATKLTTGEVLVTGGATGNTSTGITAFANTELYSPSTESWSNKGLLNTPRYRHASILLPSGKVLVIGGSDSTGNPLASSELYDPATGTWSYTGNMITARIAPTAVLLQNGKVLVSGGPTSTGWSTAASEIFDPATGVWVATGSMSTVRSGHSATLLQNGKVLVVGGSGATAYLTSSELYDPTTGIWTTSGALNQARSWHTATMLSSGKVLVTGAQGLQGISTSELYDPATGIWTASGNLSTIGHVGFTATLLANGQVLTVGGNTGAGLEQYDSGTRGWTSIGEMTSMRFSQTATLLDTGKVLVCGGWDSAGSLSSCNLY